MRVIAMIAIAALTACSYVPQATPNDNRRLVLAEQGYFFVGGHYVASKDGRIRVGQMYVQYQIPENRTQPYPVVMWHGGGQTGTNFMGTPDGRMGWGDYFLQRGYAVYIVDQPGRARSGYFSDVYGPTRRPSTDAMQSRFTVPEQGSQYPQATLHTQWPGGGIAGDETFDQFFASQVEDMADLAAMERLNRDAGIALLEKIGPSILLTHSQSGPFGWALADARPTLAKGILAIEPNGPPFYENTVVGAPDWFKDGPMGRSWGITRNPLTFSPAVHDPEQLHITRQTAPSGSDLVRCWLPTSPAPQLPNLQGTPILIVVSEASYHAPYDHCTSQFLAQAGVANDFVRLTDVNIRGNGHMMMLEKNNLEIAAFLDRWARQHITQTGTVSTGAMPKEVAGQQTGEALTHFNHVATGFDGAPGGRGLVVTAAIEVNAAMMYANFAAGNPTNLDAMKTNIRNVLHALVPEQGAKGPGLGFGVKRAAEAVVIHIELAVKSPGASETLRKLGPAVAQAGRAVAARAQEMADLGKRVLAAQTAAQAAPLVGELRALALQLDLGRDANGNGQIEVNAIEPGMNQLEAQVYSIFEGDRLPRVLR